MPASALNLDLLASLVTWVAIGLITYWARKSTRPKGRVWILVYGIGGAATLPWVAWDYIQKGEKARRAALARRAAAANADRAGQPAPSKRRPAPSAGSGGAQPGPDQTPTRSTHRRLR